MSDFRTGLNLENFTRSAGAVLFFKCYHNFDLKSFDSNKVCEIKLARVQGKQGLVMHFENSYFRCEIDEYLPVKFSPAANTLISKPTQEKKFVIQQSNKLREKLDYGLPVNTLVCLWSLQDLKPVIVCLLWRSGTKESIHGSTSGKILDTPLEFLEEFSQKYLYGSTLNLNAKVNNFIHNNNWVIPTNAVYDLDFIWENINDIASHQGENDEVVWTVSAK
ncbi:hypothetical protein GIB67_035125, partial [Kingdonia uniflora]